MTEGFLDKKRDDAVGIVVHAVNIGKAENDIIKVVAVLIGVNESFAAELRGGIGGFNMIDVSGGFGSWGDRVAGWGGSCLLGGGWRSCC